MRSRGRCQRKKTARQSLPCTEEYLYLCTCILDVHLLHVYIFIGVFLGTQRGSFTRNSSLCSSNNTCTLSEVPNTEWMVDCP
eukprot:3100279-Karenia_brevis.AAC.1